MARSLDSSRKKSKGGEQLLTSAPSVGMVMRSWIPGDGHHLCHAVRDQLHQIKAGRRHHQLRQETVMYM